MAVGNPVQNPAYGKSVVSAVAFAVTGTVKDMAFGSRWVEIRSV